MKLSVVISAFNEEKKILECVKSVDFADEIILVDNDSSDRTAALAKKYVTKIYSRPNNLMLNVNKNFGFSKVEGEWILSLDADERVTEELKEQILAVVNEDDAEFNGYWIPRKNIIFGKWIQHNEGWYPDFQLRLFRRGKGKFPEEHVHEKLKVTGETDKLTEPLLHLNIDTVSQFLNKHAFVYAPNEAEQLIKKGYVFDWKDVIKMPFNEFLSRFFAREGYKDGFHGLVLSLLLASYHLMIFVYIWEKKDFFEFPELNVLQETEKESKQVRKDIKYWFAHEKLKKAKGLHEKMWRKVRQGFG